MRHFKITDKDGRTFNDTQWGENITHEITKPGNTLCSKEVFHGYRTAEQAIFFNYIHGVYNEDTMLLWETEGEPVVDDGTKLGFKRQTVLRQIDKPVITTEQRIEIAICCALAVYKEPAFVQWANDWLSGKNKTIEATKTIRAATEAARVALWATEADAWATGAATWATEAAARATEANARATEVDAWAAEAVTRAAEADAWATVKTLNIVAIIEEVVGKGKNRDSGR